VSARLAGRTPFTLTDLARLAEFFGVPLAYLVEPAGVA
jgi:hypothetical protein